MAAAKHPLIQLLKPFASLKLTVILLSMSIFLVFAGTVAQVEKGIWTVVEEHFRCWITQFSLQIFFPRAIIDVPDQIYIPFVGGKTIGVALLINLIAAHSVRFKVTAKGTPLYVGLGVLAVAIIFTALIIRGIFDPYIAATEGDATMRVLYRLLKGTGAAVALLIGCMLVFRKRAGIVLVHAGVILLLIAEFYTAYNAVEAKMRIPEGESRNWTYNTRFAEIAVTDPSDADKDRVIAIPQRRLKLGKTISHEALPFDLEVTRILKNSRLVDARKLEDPSINPATKGAGLTALAVEEPEAGGASADQRINIPSTYVRFLSKDGSQDLGTYLLSIHWVDNPQPVVVNGKPYEVELRFERTYKPYSIRLIDFRHERYVGTDRPKDFSSFVHLSDPSRNVERDVRIWMNNPLRYAGETFYQQSFDGGDTITILQVVRNDSWMIPYVSCMIVLVGLTAHFASHLQGFLRRRLQHA